MRKVFFVLVTIWLWAVFIVTSLICTLIALVIKLFTMGFDKRLAVLQQFSCFWGSLYVWLSPLWTVRMEGLEKVDRRKAYVMVSNHQSLLDIVVIDRTFLHYKWVAKAELFNVPLIGWRMRMNRNVRIDRANVASQRRMLRACIQHIQEGSSVMIFPEGTRSRTGAMGPFREGAFYVAKTAGADILPMVITGTREALPRTGLTFKSFQKITLRVLDPVPYSAFKDLSEKETAQLVRARMEAALNNG